MLHIQHVYLSTLLTLVSQVLQFAGSEGSRECAAASHSLTSFKMAALASLMLQSRVCKWNDNCYDLFGLYREEGKSEKE